MVSNAALAAICVHAGFHKILLHDSSSLAVSIEEYMEVLKAAKKKEEQLADKEGRSVGQFWSEIEPPKVSG